MNAILTSTIAYPVNDVITHQGHTHVFESPDVALATR